MSAIFRFSVIALLTKVSALFIAVLAVATVKVLYIENLNLVFGLVLGFLVFNLATDLSYALMSKTVLPLIEEMNKEAAVLYDSLKKDVK